MTIQDSDIRKFKELMKGHVEAMKVFDEQSTLYEIGLMFEFEDMDKLTSIIKSMEGVIGSIEIITDHDSGYRVDIHFKMIDDSTLFSEIQENLHEHIVTQRIDGYTIGKGAKNGKR